MQQATPVLLPLAKWTDISPAPTQQRKPVTAPKPAFNLPTQDLQAIVERSGEAWNYVIFWKSSSEMATGAPLFSWGNGYCCDNDKHWLTISASHAPDIVFFYHLSRERLLPGDFGRPSMELTITDQETWIAAGLSDAVCPRAREAYTFGVRTMVYVPVGKAGVIELASTDVILRTAECVDQILSLLNPTVSAASWEPFADDDDLELDPLFSDDDVSSSYLDSRYE